MPSPDFRFSHERSATPKLSIYVPPRNLPQRSVSSRFFEDLRHPPHSAVHSSHTVAPHASMSAQDVEAGATPSAITHSAARAMHNRFARLFFDLRTFSNKKGHHPPQLSTQQPNWHEWPPLHIEKRPSYDRCCEHCRQQSKNHRRLKIIFWLLWVLLLIWLLLSTALLTAGVLPASSSAVSSISSTSTLSLYAQECVTQYVINAPSTPLSYPCGQCFSILQGVPSSFLDANSSDAVQVQDALQFCALRSIYQEMDSQGQSLLANGSWVQNVDFCAWTNIACDGSGRVSSLKLSAPAVPAVLPSQISGLSGLQSLQLIGDTSIPAGALPPSFTSLSELSVIDLEGSAITILPDDLFSSLNKVTTLTLIRNTKMGNNLPSSIANLSLQNLIVNQQALVNALTILANSSAIRSSLKLIDLSSTGLMGSIPSSISSLTSLVELHLDNNNLTNPLPPTFPPNLEVLSLANNTGLSGTVSNSFCTLSALQQCDVSGTGLAKPAGGCGVCQFS